MYCLDICKRYISFVSFKSDIYCPQESVLFSLNSNLLSLITGTAVCLLSFTFLHYAFLRVLLQFSTWPCPLHRITSRHSLWLRSPSTLDYLYISSLARPSGSYALWDPHSREGRGAEGGREGIVMLHCLFLLLLFIYIYRWSVSLINFHPLCYNSDGRAASVPFYHIPSNFLVKPDVLFHYLAF